MATMAMEREPEVAGFMEHYKYDQHQSEAYRKYGGGTSLPLNSDGLEERQRRLRDERHKDWMQQQEKQPKYYRVGTPEGGLPGLGRYEEQRKQYDRMRQNDYLAFREKQKKLEGERMEARRRISPPRQRPPPGMDYTYVQEQSRAMDKKAYQDYMKQKQERELALRGRPVTPPGGLDIGQYDRRLKEEGPQKKKEYKAMLDQQKQEHMFLRARQEHEIPVIERNTGRLPVQSPSHLANKPPPGPNHRPREEAFQTDSNPPPHPNALSPRQRQAPTPPWLENHKQGQGQYRGNQNLSGAGIEQPNSVATLDDSWIKERRRVAGMERKEDYNVFMKNKMDHERRRHDEIRQNAESTKPMPVVKNAYYGSEEHEAYVQKQKQQLGQEYLDYLNKDQSNKKHELQSPRRNFVYPTVAVAEKPLVDHLGHEVEKRQRDLKQELKRDLEMYQTEQRAQEPRRHEYMDTSKSPYEGGLFNNLGEHGGSKDKLMEQRRQEYNEHLQHNQRPTGRPNWVKEPLPNDHHGGRRPEQAADRQYEAMLEEKRREESLRRRYDPDMSYPRNGEGASRERQYRPGY